MFVRGPKSRGRCGRTQEAVGEPSEAKDVGVGRNMFSILFFVFFLDWFCIIIYTCFVVVFFFFSCKNLRMQEVLAYQDTQRNAFGKSYVAKQLQKPPHTNESMLVLYDFSLNSFEALRYSNVLCSTKQKPNKRPRKQQIVVPQVAPLLENLHAGSAPSAGSCRTSASIQRR